MTVAKWGRLLAYLGNRLMPGCLILLYHRVADEPNDPLELCVSPANFDQQMEVLRECFRPVPLAQITERGHDNGVAPRIAVTFDDGYRDVFYSARPILERHGIPATVFVITGSIDNERGFWWDELVELILGQPNLPGEIALEIGGRVYCWSTKSVEEEFTHAANQRARQSSENHLPTFRQTLHARIRQLFRRLSDLQRQQALAQLRQQIGFGISAPCERRGLSSTELGQLAQSGTIEIGAHTVTHPVLSNLSLAEQEREILTSKQDLENLLDASIHSFAYPYGTRSDFTEATAKAVAKADFVRALSTVLGVVRAYTCPFHLPRIPIKDWDGAKFLGVLASLGLYRGEA